MSTMIWILLGCVVILGGWVASLTRKIEAVEMKMARPDPPPPPSPDPPLPPECCAELEAALAAHVTWATAFHLAIIEKFVLCCDDPNDPNWPPLGPPDFPE